MKLDRVTRYQTYVVSCWQEQGEYSGKTSWRFRLEIPRTGEQRILRSLQGVIAVIEDGIKKSGSKNLKPL